MLLGGYVICIKHLVPNDKRWNEFVSKINYFFDKYSNVDIRLMGFPENWIEVLTSDMNSL